MKMFQRAAVHEMDMTMIALMTLVCRDNDAVCRCSHYNQIWRASDRPRQCPSGAATSIRSSADGQVTDSYGAKMPGIAHLIPSTPSGFCHRPRPGGAGGKLLR